MTNQQHPITPPPDLVEQWLKEFYGAKLEYVAEASIHLAARAAQWGSDQELEACIAWFDTYIPGYELVADRLRAARRPKPSSLKEQALALLNKAEDPSWDINDFSIVRRALEQLDD
jgi:hypothetical protein